MAPDAKTAFSMNFLRDGFMYFYFIEKSEFRQEGNKTAP
jgi:hypothetical protein